MNKTERRLKECDMEEEFDPVQVVIDDLAMQVAETAVGRASWKARAISAERKLEQLAKEAPEDDEGILAE